MTPLAPATALAPAALTPSQCYAAGYLAGQQNMRTRAARCCHFDVYNIGPSTEADVLALAAPEPVVNAAGEILVEVVERGESHGVPPPVTAREFRGTYFRPGPHGFIVGTVDWRSGQRFDQQFPGWRKIAVPLPGWPSPDAPPAPPVSSEAPEPPGGFMALSEAKLWGTMWAAGYDLPAPEKYADPRDPGGCDLASVTAGPFEGQTVAVCERAGPWAACELGVKSPDETDWFVAVRLCHLRFWTSVRAVEFTKGGKKILTPHDPPHVPPQYDETGTLKCPDTPNAAAPSWAGGGPPETHPCV